MSIKEQAAKEVTFISEVKAKMKSNGTITKVEGNLKKISKGGYYIENKK